MRGMRKKLFILLTLLILTFSLARAVDPKLDENKLLEGQVDLLEFKEISDLNGKEKDKKDKDLSVVLDEDSNQANQEEQLEKEIKEKKISEQEGQDKENGKISKKFIWPTKHDLKTILKKNDTATRLAGRDRYETSTILSNKLLDKQSIVIVASGKDYADALSGSSLVQACFPIILTEPDILLESVREEIKRLSPEKILLLGGTSAVSLDVENELKKITETERIAGKNRYETAIQIASYLETDSYIVASGENFPDGLASGILASSYSSSILLSKSEVLEESFGKFLTNKGVCHLSIIGGETVITKSLENIIRSNDEYLDRIFGKDRFSTAVEIARATEEKNGKPKAVIIANGFNFPDALSASLLSQSLKAPILFTDKEWVCDSTRDYLYENKETIDDLFIIGGEEAISKAVEDYLLEHIIDGTEKPKPMEKPLVIKEIDYSILESRLKNFLDKSGISRNNVGFSYIDFDNSKELHMNADSYFTAASTTKWPLNLMYYDLSNKGALDLSTKIATKWSDMEGGTGILQFERIGNTYSLNKLLELSITKSDNVATNALYRYMGYRTSVRQNWKDNYGISVLSENRIKPRDALKVVKITYENSEKYSDLIYNLENTMFNSYFTGDIETRAAHKIGLYNGYFNDIGIVYHQKPYGFAIYTRGLSNPAVFLSEFGKIVDDWHIEEHE